MVLMIGIGIGAAVVVIADCVLFAMLARHI